MGRLDARFRAYLASGAMVLAIGIAVVVEALLVRAEKASPTVGILSVWLLLLDVGIILAVIGACLIGFAPRRAAEPVSGGAPTTTGVGRPTPLAMAPLLREDLPSRGNRVRGELGRGGNGPTGARGMREPLAPPAWAGYAEPDAPVGTPVSPSPPEPARATATSEDPAPSSDPLHEPDSPSAPTPDPLAHAAPPPPEAGDPSTKLAPRAYGPASSAAVTDETTANGSAQGDAESPRIGGTVAASTEAAPETTVPDHSVGPEGLASLQPVGAPGPAVAGLQAAPVSCVRCGTSLEPRNAWRKCVHCGRTLCANCFLESFRLHGQALCDECASTRTRGPLAPR